MAHYMWRLVYIILYDCNVIIDNNTVYEGFKNDRDIIHNRIIDVLNSITPIPNPNPTETIPTNTINPSYIPTSTDTPIPTKTPTPTYTPTPTKSIDDLLGSNGFIFYESGIAYYLLSDSLVLIKLNTFKIEYEYDYYNKYDNYYFENFTMIEDKSWFYFNENDTTKINKNTNCKVENKEYAYKEIKDLCDPAKKFVQDIIKKVNLPEYVMNTIISIANSFYSLSHESIIYKFYIFIFIVKKEDMRYIVDNYHIKTYPVNPSDLYYFNYRYDRVEIIGPFFTAKLDITNNFDFDFTASYQHQGCVVNENRTETFPNGNSYVKFNPDDDIFFVSLKENCYSDCYYYDIIKSLKKEEVLKLFEESFRNNFTNKVSDYLNKTFDDNSATPTPYNYIKSRNLDNTNEFYHEETWLAWDNHINYAGLFTNEKQLVLIIQEEKEKSEQSTLFQMKYVIDNFNKKSISIIFLTLLLIRFNHYQYCYN